MKTTARIYIVLLALTLSFSSCMKEDFSDCEELMPAVALRFVYTHHDHTEELTDLFSDYVEDIHVYIFDLNNTFIQVVNIERQSLTDGNTLYLTLNEGEYKIVTWGNLYSTSYEVNGSENTSYSDYTLEAKETHPAIENLFYGTTLLSVKDKDITEEISLTLNTHLVRIKLLGLPQLSRSTIEGTDYSILIEGSNTLYNFDNNPAAGAATIYIPEYSGLTEKGEYIVQAEFMIQRLFIGDDLALKILQKDYFLIEEELTQRILEEYEAITTDSDLDRKYIYELYYELTPMGFVCIGNNLDDWKGTSMPGGLGG